MKYLIVNADDFGQSPGVNRGVMQAHERGILTSASLMVRWPHAADAAAYARAHPSLGVGIHLDFGEWVLREGQWQPLYSVVDEQDASAVEREVASQLAAFRRLIGRDPTHIDSHQHRHRQEPARSIIARVAEPLGLPVRGADARVRYCGRFYGQAEAGLAWPEGITVDALIGILRNLEPGFTELGCHPAAEADLDTMYKLERLQELASLCDPRVRAAAGEMGIELCAFSRVGRNPTGKFNLGA
jgi:chitin disaccharide deacetylase